MTRKGLLHCKTKKPTKQSPKAFAKGTGSHKNQRWNGDHRDFTVIKIGLGTRKSFDVMRKLVITQIPDHQRPSAGDGVKNF